MKLSRNSLESTNGRVERFGNLRLQAHLFVTADFEIRTEQRFKTRLGIILEERLIVADKGLSQIALPIRRIAGAQVGTEARQILGVKGRIAQASCLNACEFVPDFFKDFLVATAYRSARAIDCPGGIQHIPHRFLNLFGVVM